MQLKKMLNQLAAFEPVELPVISLYLNTQPDNRGRDHFDAYLRKELKAQGETLELRSPARESFDRDAERINVYLRDELRPSANGVAIFACSGANNFFEAIQLEAPLDENLLHLGRQPYLFPLERVNDQYPPFAVLVADTNAAHLYVFGLGEKLEQQDVTSVNVNRSQVGGWSQARYQRHVDNFHHQHAKEVVDELEQLMGREEIRWIVLAGDEVIIPLLREQIPKQLEDSVIDVLRLDISTPEHEVMQAGLEAVRAHNAKDDAGKLEKLFNEDVGRGLSVSGAHETLQALIRGQVEELFISASPDDVQDDLVQDDLQFVTEVADTTGSNRRPLIADELIRRARNTDARITFIEENQLIVPHGGVSAKLRFNLQSATA
ncbi:MAG TPA: Vms1/Ankzf1 family peptidyl-tRNA hydrolase [Blastocatellia bacterium]|nr:Vms1/Ankzf1 family peptidyl-tRNA hydrolase [Blastocatellia bacterium]